MTCLSLLERPHEYLYVMEEEEEGEYGEEWVMEEEWVVMEGEMAYKRRRNKLGHLGLEL